MSLRTLLRSFSRAVGGSLLHPMLALQDTTIQIQVDAQIARLKAEIGSGDPDAIVLRGFKVYSQFDEDGIIEHIFQIIGEKSRVFVEIGCANGIENNTHFLLLKGWRGLWIDGNPDNIKFVEKQLGLGPNQTLAAQQRFITRDNVNAAITEGLRDIGFEAPPREIDFLSLDIDGNDLEVLRHITVTAPRVLCVEYNAKFPPPHEVEIAYDPDHVWQIDDYHGASLQSFVNALEPRGYRLVCCNLSGANAFFVRETELGGMTDRPVEELYQPSRFYLIQKRSGHVPSLKFLRDRLGDRPK